LFINIEGFTDPLADDDDTPPPAAGVAALAATAARAAAAATAAGVARRQLKIKAHQTIWIGCAFATDARARRSKQGIQPGACRCARAARQEQSTI